MTKQAEGMLMKTLKEICDQVTELNIRMDALEGKKDLKVMEIRARRVPNNAKKSRLCHMRTR